MVIRGSTQALEEAKRTALRWKPADAIAVFPALSAMAEDHGYRVAMLGGVFLRGEGGDLDCAMLPLRGVEQYRGAFLMHFGGSLVRHYRDRFLGTDHVHVLFENRLYDFSFGDFLHLGEAKKWATRQK